VQSVPITTKAVSLNPTHGEVYSIQHYVIKFISDLPQGPCQILVGSWATGPLLNLMSVKKAAGPGEYD
jgi:hypothetical protein